MVPPSLSDPSWYIPASPTSTTQSDGFYLSTMGFNPSHRSLALNDLPGTLLGSLSLTVYQYVPSGLGLYVMIPRLRKEEGWFETKRPRLPANERLRCEPTDPIDT